MNTTYPKGALRGLAVAVLLAAPAARAQAPAAPAAPAVSAAPAAPAAPAAATAPAVAASASKGPLVPGVCLLSQETLIARSKVGQAATARLRELAGQIQANLNAEKNRLEARGKALNEKRATLTPLQIQAQSQALNQRAQALQAEAGERSAQIDATKSRAFSRVIQSAQPYITQAYAAHGCGLLFAREAVLSGNLGNDLTDEVLAAFDAKGTPITFDLEPPRPAR
ncbi:MAG: outer membrane protein [Caulobacteraceae bacterium]|nr:outer membrane protein [Caulobacteraceae bacterium]